MTVRERKRSGALTDFSARFQLVVSYRIPLQVEEASICHCGPKGDSYYRCPRCQNLLEREWMAYCSNCGQCLSWGMIPMTAYEMPIDREVCKKHGKESDRYIVVGVKF